MLGRDAQHGLPPEAAGYLRLHRQAPAGGLDDFLNRLDIGGTGEDAQGVRRFDSPDQIADWFRREQREDWRQRD